MLLGKLAREQSGIALPLAIIMIVLVGVMGAGLLTFVRTDLEAVVEVNHGQKALAAADSGIQAAKRQLLTAATADATTNLYDSNTANGNSPWSATGSGKNLSFNGESNNINVKIQYLLPSVSSADLTKPDHAPELVPPGKTDYLEPTDYFKITATGTAGQARRKIEAIYVTGDLGVPKGYYTPDDITVSGSACIDSVSLFSQGDVTFNGSGGCPGGGHLTGTDFAYGKWVNDPFNTTARATNLAGVGSVGTINPSSKRVPGRDYDATTLPKFIFKSPPAGSQTASQMSFPFDYALPDQNLLRDIAKANGTYYEVSGGTANISSWPAPPAGSDASSTVVFYKFTSGGANTLKWEVPGDCDEAADNKTGTVVVENGNFTSQPNRARFVGAVVVRGGDVTDGTADDTGRSCLEGFVNASGDIKVAGNVHAGSTEALAKRPGWYNVTLWSWRELYE